MKEKNYKTKSQYLSIGIQTKRVPICDMPVSIAIKNNKKIELKFNSNWDLLSNIGIIKFSSQNLESSFYLNGNLYLKSTNSKREICLPYFYLREGENILLIDLKILNYEKESKFYLDKDIFISNSKKDTFAKVKTKYIENNLWQVKLKIHDIDKYAHVEIKIKDNNKVMYCSDFSDLDRRLEFNVKNVKGYSLWHPKIYSLEMMVTTKESKMLIVQKIAFKDIVFDNDKCLLNGEEFNARLINFDMVRYFGSIESVRYMGFNLVLLEQKQISLENIKSLSKNGIMFILLANNTIIKSVLDKIKVSAAFFKCVFSLKEIDKIIEDNNYWLKEDNELDLVYFKERKKYNSLMDIKYLSGNKYFLYNKVAGLLYEDITMQIYHMLNGAVMKKETVTINDKGEFDVLEMPIKEGVRREYILAFSILINNREIDFFHIVKKKYSTNCDSYGLTISSNNSIYSISYNDIEYRICKETGFLLSIIANSKENVLNTKNKFLKLVKVNEEKHSLTFLFENNSRIIYGLTSDGTLSVTCVNFDKYEFKFPVLNSLIKWYGLGPYSSKNIDNKYLRIGNYQYSFSKLFNKEQSYRINDIRYFGIVNKYDEGIYIEKGRHNIKSVQIDKEGNITIYFNSQTKDTLCSFKVGIQY